MPRRLAYAHGATATAGTRLASFADTLHRNPTALQGQRDALYDLRETPERVGHLVVASCACRLAQAAPRPANRDEADAMPVQEPRDLLCHGIPRMAQPCTLRGIESSQAFRGALCLRAMGQLLLTAAISGYCTFHCGLLSLSGVNASASRSFTVTFYRSEPAASLQHQAHTLSGHTDHVGLVRRGHAAYSDLGISLQMFRSGLASVPLSHVSSSCKCLEGYTAVGQVWFRYQEVISVQI
jgi:hypothetical protein